MCDSPCDPSRARPLGCAGLLPRLRSKGLAVWKSLQRRVVEVSCVEVNSVTPPDQLLTAAREDNSEEDNNGGQGDTEVEGERENVVVSHPPHEAVTTEVELEDEANECPRSEVDTGGGRHTRRAEPKDGDVDVAEERPRVLASEEVEGDRSNRANEQEPDSGVVPGRNVSRLQRSTKTRRLTSD